MSKGAFMPNAALNAQLDPTLVQNALALIEPAHRIVLLAHEHPDGDCIGSALGLAYILRQMGKESVPACADPAPRNLSFLPGIEMLRQRLDDEDFDLVIALDAGELRRFGPLYEQHRAFFDTARILNIDHHISSDGCGQVNIIDTASAATAELLVLFQQQASLPVNREAAICLLTGIITDTSSFQFTNTTPRTFECAAQLMRAGAIPEQIIQPVYCAMPLAQLRFQSMILANTQTSCEGRLAWSTATGDTLEAAGALPEMDENVSTRLHDIDGVEIAAFLKSYVDPDVTRLSLRASAPYNAAEICQRISKGMGGGHPRAAGATFSMPIDEATRYVVGELEKELQGSTS
jgi:phosphoesterase RecJ-like protein